MTVKLTKFFSQGHNVCKATIGIKSFRYSSYKNQINKQRIRTAYE